MKHTELYNFLIDTYFIKKPQDLKKGISNFYENNDIEGNIQSVLAEVKKLLCRPQDAVSPVNRFGLKLREWNNSEDGKWINKTLPKTVEREKLIYRELGFNKEDILQCEHAGLHRENSDQVTISQKPRQKIEIKKSVFWRAYEKYLKINKRWPDKAISDIDVSSDEVLKNILSSKDKVTKGLVIGYVQSGKTANFIGLAAKAFDQEYDLVIVLAGMQNLLRFQTQKRFDKDLLGKLNKSVLSEYEDENEDFSNFLKNEINRLTSKRDMGGSHKDFELISKSIGSNHPSLAVVKKKCNNP